MKKMFIPAILVLFSAGAFASDVLQMPVTGGADVYRKMKGDAVRLSDRTVYDGMTAAPRYSGQCILKLVSGRMKIALKPDVPFPAVRFASQTPIAEFQDAVEPQWGFRPDQVLNVFVDRLNTIYLLDNSSYYNAVNRYIDDSFAHELVHYVQVKHRGDTMDESNGDFLEGEAVNVQTWFRETYMIPGVPESQACGG